MKAVIVALSVTILLTHIGNVCSGQKVKPKYGCIALKNYYSTISQTQSSYSEPNISFDAYLHFSQRINGVEVEYYTVTIYDDPILDVEHRPTKFDSTKLIFSDSCKAILRLDTLLYHLKLDMYSHIALFDSVCYSSENGFTYIFIKSYLFSWCVHIDPDYHYVLLKTKDNKLVNYIELTSAGPTSFAKARKRLSQKRSY